MTGRDRMVVMGLILLAVIAGGWLLVVSPERKQAAQQEAQAVSARSQLQGAQAQAASARTAETSYESAYTSVVNLGKAVPPQQEVPSLVYELDQASHQGDVDFNSISSGGSSSSSSSSSASGSLGSGAASASETPAAFTQMPFTFVFKGSFFGLARLLGKIDGFAQTAAGGSAGGHKASVADAGGVRVNGRLVTIQGVDITLEGEGHAAGQAKSAELTATITATAYVLPAGQGLTAGGTPAGPAGAGASASRSAAPSSPTSPAVIQGAP